MSISVNHDKARQILSFAIRSECSGPQSHSVIVRSILRGDHKTYRYILVNALLAKATDARINPLAIQAKSHLAGAYDARSLCHKVLVPFEREFLANALGGSNEPFLNKPARIPELAMTNPVREGKDKQTLKKLVDLLSRLESSEMAISLLICALKDLSSLAKELKEQRQASAEFSSSIMEAYRLLMEFSSETAGGESMVIVVGALEKLGAVERAKVKVHKVNQSGQSSNEIGDIDVSMNGVNQYSIEVKDKLFDFQDVEHAFAKMIEGGCRGGIFVTRGEFLERADITDDRVASIGNSHFLSMVISLEQYARIQLLKFSDLDNNNLFQTMLDVAHDANMSNHSVRRIHRFIQGFR